ncbi:MAG: hypothetical protein A3I89_00650 [Candidatus Harrisonbacteria bacterium RIFCSPLOWO2_02_FULL_41_11]|nr:MAG: hypothetical protein A3I89_00650 [Candidatus Harrisonbacteria bacterium RIFCSPLOWO2_02_FULL_41_11]
MNMTIEHHRRIRDILAIIFLTFLILLTASPKRERPGVQKVLFEYIEITGGCGPNFKGECLSARSGPGEDYPAVMKLRNGTMLRVGEKIEHKEQTWYKIVFDEKIRYPERITTDWYVSADYARAFLDEGLRETKDPTDNAASKRIIIDRSEQVLYAYGKDGLFMKEPISTGLELTPTPRGIFTIFKKTPSRYMQGPIPGITNQYYDLPGVPWDLYFTHQGAAIHGTYWHENFGKQSSHGCVNLPPTQAEKLYRWAGIGTFVIVQD